MSENAQAAIEAIDQPDPDEIRAHAEDAARLLKALANSARLQVLCSLVDGELSVGQINENVALSQSALSQHLAILRREGLVSTRRCGQTIYYALAGKAVQRVLEVLHDIYCAEGHSVGLAKACGISIARAAGNQNNHNLLLANAYVD